MRRQVRSANAPPLHRLRGRPVVRWLQRDAMARLRSVLYLVILLLAGVYVAFLCTVSRHVAGDLLEVTESDRAATTQVVATASLPI